MNASRNIIYLMKKKTGIIGYDSNDSHIRTSHSSHLWHWLLIIAHFSHTYINEMAFYSLPFVSVEQFSKIVRKLESK